MSEKGLQADLQSDIETLKRLRLGIMPAKMYYKKILKGWFFIYFSLLGALFMACFFANSINAWPYTKDYVKGVEKIKKYGHAIESFSLRDNDRIDLEIRKPYAEKIAQLKKEEEGRHFEVVINMVIEVIGVSLFFMIFISGYIKLYVIYKHQIMQHLKSGEYLLRKVWQAFGLFIGCYTFFSLITVSLMDQDMVGFAAIPSFIVTAFVSSFIFDMELSRIGISPLTNAISDYFAKENKQPVQNN